MKKVLIIKTSSLGDVIHTLPALTDAKAALGDVQFDWVVEENFAEIPAWHPDVRNIIPVAIRRWRKQIFKTIFSGEWKKFKQQLQQEQYDYVIDAQGLLKSALIARLARGQRYGLDKQSAREPIASYFYQYPQAIDKHQHAVERVRHLFARSLGYQLDDLPLNYGIAEYITLSGHTASFDQVDIKANVESNSASKGDSSRRILFLHGTTWATKHWPEQYWIELADRMSETDYTIVLPWGNEAEHQRALRIKQKSERERQVVVLDKMSLNELLKQIINVDAVVAVDTGLAHLSAAIGKPTVALYGPTSPGLTGTYGKNQLHLQADIECAPCFKKKCIKTKYDKKYGDIAPECFSHLTPVQVAESLHELLSRQAS